MSVRSTQRDCRCSKEDRKAAKVKRLEARAMKELNALRKTIRDLNNEGLQFTLFNRANGSCGSATAFSIEFADYIDFHMLGRSSDCRSDRHGVKKIDS